MPGENVVVAEEVDETVREKFEIAVLLVKSLPQSASFSPSYAEATKIYSYFKQSKFGPCSIPRPGFWDVVNRAKWDAWSALADMSTEDAMKKYVEEIKKVYYRIKDIEAFEEKHVEFADALIPFCQATNTPLTTKLMEIVKRSTPKEQPIQLNGSGINGDMKEVGENTHADSNNVPNTNGVDAEIYPSMNGECPTSSDVRKDGVAPSDVRNDGVAPSDVRKNGGSSSDVRNDAPSTPSEVYKVSKSVKFQINDDSNNDNNMVHVTRDLREEEVGAVGKDGAYVKVEVEKNTKDEKEEGELSSSENDSDDGEIYCDSLDPDQIIQTSKQEKLCESTPVVNNNNNNHQPLPSVLSIAPVKSTVTEPLLFSPIPPATDTVFQDMTSQNILTKSADHSRSSSNNSRESDYEIVDPPPLLPPRDEQKNFQSVRKRDVPAVSTMTNASCPNEHIPLLDKNVSSRKTTIPVKNESAEKHATSEHSCPSCLRSHKKHGGHHSYARQNHSGRRNDNGGPRSSRNSSNGNSTSNNHSNGYHHHHHHHDNHNTRSTSEGSNNGGSEDDSCSSSSSSSDNNVGLKIVKALERMDDNMQLILKRLDSIDCSMKILATQPPPPWWLKHIPSKLVILSTLWPFIVNLIFIYMWRRKRRRVRRKLEAIPTSWNQT